MSFRPTKEYLYTPRPCPYCERMMDKEMLLERGKKRGKAVSDALKAAKKIGDPVGRPRSVDFKRIIDLRKTGLSIRKIADKMGCSTHTVQRALASDNPAPRNVVKEKE